MKKILAILTLAAIGATCFAAENIKKTEKTATDSQVLFRSEFKQNPGDNLKLSGGFSFGNWAGSKNEVSGGLTGLKPTDGKPAEALEVKATDKGFSGRASAKIKLPATFKELVITGKFMVSKDYQGNFPRVFAYVMDKNKKAKNCTYFIKNFENGVWDEFTFKVPFSKFPPDSVYFLLHLTTQKQDSVGVDKAIGSVFYKDIVVSVQP